MRSSVSFPWKSTFKENLTPKLSTSFEMGWARYRTFCLGLEGKEKQPIFGGY